MTLGFESSESEEEEEEEEDNLRPSPEVRLVIKFHM